MKIQYNFNGSENVFWFEYKQNILHLFMNLWGILSVHGKVYRSLGTAFPMQSLHLAQLLPQHQVDA